MWGSLYISKASVEVNLCNKMPNLALLSPQLIFKNKRGISKLTVTPGNLHATGRKLIAACDLLKGQGKELWKLNPLMTSVGSLVTQQC